MKPKVILAVLLSRAVSFAMPRDNWRGLTVHHCPVCYVSMGDSGNVDHSIGCWVRDAETAFAMLGFHSGSVATEIHNAVNRELEAYRARK